MNPPITDDLLAWLEWVSHETHIVTESGGIVLGGYRWQQLKDAIKGQPGTETHAYTQRIREWRHCPSRATTIIDLPDDDWRATCICGAALTNQTGYWWRVIDEVPQYQCEACREAA